MGNFIAFVIGVVVYWASENYFLGFITYLVGSFVIGLIFGDDASDVRSESYRDAQRQEQERQWHRQYYAQQPPDSDPLEEAYSTLGIDSSAADDEVRRAYRRQARMSHPDINHAPDATAQFRRINEAYETIKSARGL